MRFVIILFLMTLTSTADADWSGKVVGVHDGDTLTIMHNGVAEKVRLVEIDAPELGQAYGNNSKQSLSELCFGQQATIKDQGKDKYGRTLGRVDCAGKDANLEQVKAGMAWFYVEYGHDQAIKMAETQAKEASAGLWADSAPQAPWEFRHGGSTSAKAKPEDKNGSGSGCGGKSTCGDMSNCAEARHYLKDCGLQRLDRDHDGIPCESICGH